MTNKSINIKEEIKKKFRDSYIVLSDEGGYARIWGKEEDDVDIESFLSNSLDRMREETAKDVIRDIQVWFPDLFVNELKSKYGIEIKSKA